MAEILLIKISAGILLALMIFTISFWSGYEKGARDIEASRKEKQKIVAQRKEDPLQKFSPEARALYEKIMSSVCKTENLYITANDILQGWCGDGCKGDICPINQLALKEEMSCQECREWIEQNPSRAVDILNLPFEKGRTSKDIGSFTATLSPQLEFGSNFQGK